jgi:Na+-driven multidrug efflux pump
MMVITIVLVALIIGGIAKQLIDEYDVAGVCIAICFSILLGFVLLIWSAAYYGSKAEIERFYSVKQTIEVSRESQASEIERAALAKEIIETNRWLAGKKYWNKTIIGDLIPDEIENLTPLK